MWSVQDAKSHLSELMRRARAGEPQTIGTRDGCVLISADEFARLNAIDRGDDPERPKLTLGQYLLTMPKVDGFELPPRGPDRPNPFVDSDAESK